VSRFPGGHWIRTLCHGTKIELKFRRFNKLGFRLYVRIFCCLLCSFFIGESLCFCRLLLLCKFFIGESLCFSKVGQSFLLRESGNFSGFLCFLISFKLGCSLLVSDPSLFGNSGSFNVLKPFYFSKSDVLLLLSYSHSLSFFHSVVLILKPL